MFEVLFLDKFGTNRVPICFLPSVLMMLQYFLFASLVRSAPAGLPSNLPPEFRETALKAMTLGEKILKDISAAHAAAVEVKTVWLVQIGFLFLLLLWFFNALLSSSGFQPRFINIQPAVDGSDDGNPVLSRHPGGVPRVSPGQSEDGWVGSFGRFHCDWRILCCSLVVQAVLRVSRWVFMGKSRFTHKFCFQELLRLVEC